MEHKITWADVVIDERTRNVMDLKKLLTHPKFTETWPRTASNEYGRLFQGCGRNEDGTQQVEGIKACHWIRKSQVLKGEIATYNRTVADIRPEKAESNPV